MMIVSLALQVRAHLHVNGHGEVVTVQSFPRTIRENSEVGAAEPWRNERVWRVKPSRDVSLEVFIRKGQAYRITFSGTGECGYAGRLLKMMLMEGGNGSKRCILLRGCVFVATLHLQETAMESGKQRSTKWLQRAAQHSSKDRFHSQSKLKTAKELHTFAAPGAAAARGAFLPRSRFFCSFFFLLDLLICWTWIQLHFWITQQQQA
jgi:hypothetical protein